MSWVKLDDHFADHPKVVQAGPDAFCLHVFALCYCARFLTDGLFPKNAVRIAPLVKRPAAAVRALLDAGLWSEGDAGYEIHDYLEYNPSRAAVEAERAHAKARGALNRDSALAREIRARDGERCRYCGQVVNFQDRRSPIGGQYDHVIPRGPNTLENVVVACRGCNQRKAGRTPDEAGMNLLGPGELAPGIRPDTGQVESKSGSNGSRTPVPVPEVPSEPLLTAQARPQRATTIPLPYTLTDKEIQWAYNARPEISWELETEKFVDFWRGKSGKDATKRDWPATWRNWIRNARSPR